MEYKPSTNSLLEYTNERLTENSCIRDLFVNGFLLFYTLVISSTNRECFRMLPGAILIP